VLIQMASWEGNINITEGIKPDSIVFQEDIKREEKKSLIKEDQNNTKPVIEEINKETFTPDEIK
jgi:hypothetical protein